MKINMKLPYSEISKEMKFEMTYLNKYSASLVAHITPGNIYILPKEGHNSK
jgi:hypothetical protein